MKKILSLVLALCLAFGLVSFASAEEALPTFDQLVLGENADLTAKIHFAYHRTDIPDKLNGYVEEFRKIYPNVEIEYELITDYAENALLRVGNTDWTIMGIPTVQKDELSKYFVPLGSLDVLDGLRADHFGVGAPGAHLPEDPAVARIGHAGHRRCHDSRGDLDISDPKTLFQVYVDHAFFRLFLS